jgi:hypothetical protein
MNYYLSLFQKNKNPSEISPNSIHQKHPFTALIISGYLLGSSGKIGWCAELIYPFF